MMKTQRAAREKRAGGDSKSMLKFLGGRNMGISSWQSAYLPACSAITSKAAPEAWQTVQLSPNLGSVLM